MKAALLFVVCSITAQLSFGYPIPPRPLRKLILESEFIIVATVLKTGNIQHKKEELWETSYALLRVEKQLQGHPVPDTITVYYTAGMICPTPARYTEGDRIITFLDKNPNEKNSYLTHALSYGVKSFSNEENRNIYVSRILEMQKIQTISKPAKKHEEIINWLIKCASNPVTRWEGVYELSPESDFMSYYDDDKSMKKSVFLNTAQKELLFESFTSVDKPDPTDLYMVDIIAGVNDGVLLTRLKSSLVNAEPEDNWESSIMMIYIVRLTDNRELEAIEKKFTKSLHSNPPDGKEPPSRQLYKDFIKKMENVPAKQSLSTVGINAG